ncbi:endonuclease/exonuclease/phosphatase family protein, partial [Cooperia oncophora]
MDFDRAINLVVNDASLPPHLKTVMNFLVDLKDQIGYVLARNKELQEENESVRRKNSELISEVNSLNSQIIVLKKALSSHENFNQSQVSSQPSTLVNNFEEVERRRSVVIIGVKESSAALSSDRVLYDSSCVRQILDYLSVDCRPISIYRMGRFVPNKARLLKVVFPSSFFASLPSLSKSERDLLRVQRLTRVATHVSPSVCVNNGEAEPSSTVGNSTVLSQAPGISDALTLLIKSGIDIIALTETWLNPAADLPPLLSDACSNYTVIRCDRDSARGGGVAMLVRNSLAPVVLFSESAPRGYEILCCDVRTGLSLTRFVLVYRTPSCTVALTDQMLKAISDVISCNSSCVVTGDFNFPELQWDSSPKITGSSSALNFRTFCQNYGLAQLVRDCTRGGHLLDLVMSNDVSLISDVEVKSPLGFSDHYSLHFKVNVCAPTRST